MATATPDDSASSNDAHTAATGIANGSATSSATAVEDESSSASTNTLASTSTSATESVPKPDAAISVAEDASGDEAKELKLSWLRLLPFEQVVSIVLKLDAHATEEVKAEVWPSDLKHEVELLEAGRSADEERAQEVDAELSNKSILDSESATTAAALATEVGPDAATSAVQTPPPPIAPPDLPPAFPVPPMAALPPPPGPPPTPHAAYPYNPYTPFPPHPFTHAHAHAFSPPPPPPPPPSSSSLPAPAPSPLPSGARDPSTPLFTSAPLIRSVIAPPKPPLLAHPGEEEPSLPSYEIMLHHALTVLNDPAGVVPKNLFAWIALHYPVQANFRPSASQALTKAYKRGRFEKTKDGRYRLNQAWEGGSTSRRTTRRPANTFRHAMLPAMFPPPMPHPAHHFAHPPMEGLSHAFPHLAGLHHLGQSVPGPSTGFPPSQTQEAAAAQTKEQVDAWEAAQSILQELNRQALKRLEEDGGDKTASASASASTPAPDSSSSSTPAAAAAASTGKEKDEPSTPSSTSATAQRTPTLVPAFPMPIFASTVDLDIGKKSSSSSSSSVAAAAAALAPSGASPLAGAQESKQLQQPPPPLLTSRAALQSHLVLLATQLADLAGPSHVLAIPSVAV